MKGLKILVIYSCHAAVVQARRVSIGLIRPGVIVTLVVVVVDGGSNDGIVEVRQMGLVGLVGALDDDTGRFCVLRRAIEVLHRAVVHFVALVRVVRLG